MKKFFLLLIALFTMSVTLLAQESATNDASLTNDNSYMNYTGKSTDVIGTDGDSIWHYTIKKVVPSRQIPYMYVKLDSVKSGGTVSVYLYGKKTLNSPLYGIGDTITWKMTTADTSFAIYGSAFNFLDYTQLRIVGSTDTTGAKINYFDYKVVRE